MAMRSPERRSAPRIVAKLAMQVGGGGDESVLTTESINLSVSGIQFLSRAFLSPLTKVQLSLLIPPFGSRLRRERLVRCEAIVVRCEEADIVRGKPRYELACYFSDVEFDDRVLIEQYIVWRSLRRMPSAPKVARPVTKAAKRAPAKAARKAGAKKPVARKKRATARKAGTAAKPKRRGSAS
jgi:PilZ domain